MHRLPRLLFGPAAACALLAQPPLSASPASELRAGAAAPVENNALLPATATTEADVRAIIEQNRRLQERIEEQQRQIDALRSRLDGMEAGGRQTAGAAPAWEHSAGQIRLSAEAGFAFFSSNEEGRHPNAEFRVDDARIFVEAAVWRNVYFFTGLDLTTREANDEFFHVGELYVDVEDLVSLGRGASVNLRAGRFSIPFGEEYQSRSVLANPLISHSVADIWGIDEGVQLYGSAGRFGYNIAVQNGGHETLHDSDADKAVTARVGFDPTARLHFSVSAMRTGRLDVAGDSLSEVWLANAFFRSIGPSATTRTFHSELAEIDAAWRWKHGRIAANAGWIRYDDDSTTADFSRRLSYLSVEVSQQLAGSLHGAVRFSELRAPRGYPLVGQSGAGEYFFDSFATHTKDLRRVSAGMRYEFGPPLVWKLEFTRESGHLITGVPREDTDLLASEIGVRF